MPRFVVLFHDRIDEPHFDMMFEVNGALATWRSPRWPINESEHLQRLADHRLEYLTYEGPISDNRGSVKRIANGEYIALAGAPEESRWSLQIDSCQLLLEQIEGQNWRAIVAGKK